MLTAGSTDLYQHSINVLPQNNFLLKGKWHCLSVLLQKVCKRVLYAFIPPGSKRTVPPCVQQALNHLVKILKPCFYFNIKYGLIAKIFILLSQPTEISHNKPYCPASERF